MSSAAQEKTQVIPAFLSYGFRPFFLLSSLWALVSMALWIVMLTGTLVLPSAFTSFDWHAHELIYGYVPGVVAGFLLTAVANWTGRPPVAGNLLLVLVLLWLAGRVAVFFSAHMPALLVAIIDVSFLVVLLPVAAREIAASGNRRNLKILFFIGLLLLGNILYHMEAAMTGVAFYGYGARLGIAATVILIMVIGGRIIPNFTGNWLAQRGSGRRPVSFNRFDGIALVSAVAALVLWIAAPDGAATAVLCFIAAALHLVRLVRWAGERVWSESLLLILHVGYIFVPVGFLLVGCAILEPATLTPSGALHAWTAGAIGVMTVAVMTRASLGHLGRPLKATGAISFLYVCILIAAVARIAAGFVASPQPFLHLAAAGWILAFGGFAVLFAPMLLRPVPAKRGG